MNITPPNNQELEKYVLSSLLQDEEYRDEIFELLNEKDFYNNSHKTLYKALYGLWSCKATFDTPIILNRHPEQKETVFSVIEFTITTGVVNYCHELINLRQKREILTIIYNGLKNVSDNKLMAEELISNIDSEIYKISSGKSDETNCSVGSLMGPVFENLDNIRQGKVNTGLLTGFSDLDYTMSGLQPGELTIVAARPGMGKTSFALGVSIETAKSDNVVQIFSLEMPKIQLSQRMLSTMSEFEMRYFRQGECENKNKYSMLGINAGVLNDLKIEIDDRCGIDPMYLRSRLRKTRSKYGKVNLVVIDYLQLMNLKNIKENRQQEISTISRSLKEIAKEFNTHVLSLSQLNRALANRTNKRPVLTDLRESGAIEQDADNIIFLHNESRYDERANPNIVEVIVAKQRNGGVGITQLYWDGRYTKFSNLEKQNGDDDWSG